MEPLTNEEIERLTLETLPANWPRVLGTLQYQQNLLDVLQEDTEHSIPAVLSRLVLNLATPRKAYALLTEALDDTDYRQVVATAARFLAAFEATVAAHEFLKACTPRPRKRITDPR